MLKNKFLRIVVLTLAFVMLLSFTAFADETDVSEKTTVTFGVFSDIHNVTSYMTNVMNNYETIAGGNENIDGIAMVGDIAYLDTADIPQASTYNIVKNNADLAYFMGEDKLVYAMGNHEFPLNANADPMASLSRQVFTEQMGYAPESHHVLSGYHFITAGPNTYDGKMTAAQEQYVMDEITKALADGEDKPIFVLIHHPIDGVLYGSGSTRHSDEFVEFLKSQPRVFVFDGHNHYPTSDPRSIRQIEGGATFIYTSCVHGGNNLSNPYATEKHDKAHPSQAYYMQIDTATNVVTLKRFHVAAAGPTWLDAEDWTFDVPAMVAESKKAEGEVDTENVYKYTYEVRKENSIAPVYGDDAAITITKLTTKDVSFTFPIANPGADGEDNMVGYYKIDLLHKDTGKVETIKIISDYFRPESAQRNSFSKSFSTLTYDTEYTLTVTPVNMWYIEGEPLVLNFRSEPLPAGFGNIVGYDDTFYAAPVTINGAGDGMNIDTANAFRLTEENNKRLAGIYAVSDDNFNTHKIIYVYGSGEERAALYEKPNGKFSVAANGGSNKFIPGVFSANQWVGSAGDTNFYSDTQWINTYLRAYLFATDDPEGTEGGKTAAEKKTEALKNLITYVRQGNSHVTYTLSPKAITKIGEVETLKFGFHLNAVYAQVSMTINNSVYGLKAYVMDKEGNVTTHTTSVGGITMKTGSVSYGTFNFKTATWDNALPAEGYFVAFKVYPYFGDIKPEDITLTTSVTEANLNANERLRFVATPSTFTVGVPKADAPVGIKVDGATFTGLDKRTTYSVAPYTIKGADNTKAIDITGVTSYTLPEGSVGAYGIYIKGNGIDLINSDAFVTYVRGTYSARLDLHDRLGDEAGANYTGTYKVVSTPTPGAFNYTVSEWKGHSTFSSRNGISTTGDHISAAQSKALYTAYTATDATDETKKTAFDKMISSSKLTQNYLQYNMASDEIIPISEINKYSYLVTKQRGGFTYNNQVSEFSVLIMNEVGVVTEYTYQHVAAVLSDTNVTKTVDFKNKTSSYGTWIDDLPSEGYVVGFRYKVYANLDNFANVGIASSTTGTRYMIVPTTSYIIDIPVADAPTGVTVEGTSFKNLVASKSYAVAPYTIHGVDTTLEQTVTGVTEFDVAANFENAKGTYVIYFKGDNENYTDSEPSNVVYIQGTLAEKRDIILTDGKHSIYPVKWAQIDGWYTGHIHAPYNRTASAGEQYYVPCFRATAAMSTWFFPSSTNTETNKANLPKIRYAYAYNPDEIPTVNELGDIKFKLQRQNSSLVAKAKVKVNFVVLGADGKVTNHSVMTNEYTFNTTTTSFTIDFQSIAGVPENGYVLGFEVYPFGELITMTPENTAFANLGIYFYYTSTNIVATPAEAPKGITVEGTTFKGLDANKTYVVAPYTVAGEIEEDKKTVTGVTSVDVSTLFEDMVGLYAIYFDATDYNAPSAPGAVIYVPGTYEEKLNLGTSVTKTHTYNGTSFDYTVADFEEVKESAKEWAVGKILGCDYFAYNGKDYNSYKVDWVYSVPSSKALYEAEQKNDGSFEALQKQAEATLEGISFRYAYSPEEIIPIDEVLEMKFTAAIGTTYISVINPQTKYVLYVMNTDGTISEHSYLTAYRDITGDISSNSKNEQTIVPRRDFKDLPEEGWIIGYKFYPYGELQSKNITYRETNIANASTEYGFYVRLPLFNFDGKYNIVKEEPEVEFGMSLLLDGKIGVKITANSEEAVSGLALSNVVGTDNFVDFGSNDFAVFYFDPKDAANATVSFDVTYGDTTESFTLTVADYIAALKESDDENVVNLVNASEVYFNVAADYFYEEAADVEALPEFTAEELSDIESKSERSATGTVDGIEFVSTSLLLEEDTTVRHYFKITDDSIKTDDNLAALYTVTGGASLKIAAQRDFSGIRYAYVDISDIASNELATALTVTVTDKDSATVTIDFTALSYVDLCLETEDASLLNLVKALYRYSVAADVYMAE
ncbi:MAG: metallophosphoesterase [Ruminococcaceae bacterium]|nr:metallophosphoesterase [Oscillospiraceae bacterium]